MIFSAFSNRISETKSCLPELPVSFTRQRLALLFIATAVLACHHGKPAVVTTAPVSKPAATPLPPARVIPPRPNAIGPLESGVTENDLDELWSRQLMVPVEGMSRTQLRAADYGAPRDGGERTHRALDLMAPRYTAVLAADDQIIGRLGEGAIGGIFIYATDPGEHFTYYYAHLQRYRKGLAAGDRVAKGSIIGYVGTTGNAPPNAPHLHFQVMKRGTGRAWWDGPPINAAPFFAFDGTRP